MLLTMSSSITDVSSTRVETFRRDLRSSIHLNRKMNPYTGLQREGSSCIVLVGPHHCGCSAQRQKPSVSNHGQSKDREEKQNHPAQLSGSDYRCHKSSHITEHAFLH